MNILILLILFLFPSVTFAAYQSPTVISNERQQDGSTRLVFRFTGSAGEPTVVRSYVVSSGTTATLLRNWIDGVMNELDLMHSAATLAALQPGQTVTRLAPSAPPAPTAKEVWREKVSRYQRLSIVGLTGTAATDLAALLADINATYQAGFLQ
jgi:hypothetical protein